MVRKRCHTGNSRRTGSGNESLCFCYLQFLHNDYASAEGAGAAGGLGFAFLSYLNATLTPGIDLILNAVELEKN